MSASLAAKPLQLTRRGGPHPLPARPRSPQARRDAHRAEGWTPPPGPGGGRRLPRASRAGRRAPSPRPQLQHPGAGLLGAGVDEVGAGRRAERLPVSAAEGREAVHGHEAFRALPPAGDAASAGTLSRPAPAPALPQAPQRLISSPDPAPGRHPPQRAGGTWRRSWCFQKVHCRGRARASPYPWGRC